MEFLPVLEPLDTPKEGIWYSLVPAGEGPGVSVGHTSTYISAGDEGKGKLFIVGGANPDGSFSQIHAINLDQHAWDTPQWQGLEPRYEHCSFVPKSCAQSLWVFGGAQQSGNRNTVQNIRLIESESRWKNVPHNGKPPSPRTYHTNTACIGDRVYVFSGGEAGSEPVSDPALHVFDAVAFSWSQPETQGTPPAARHGHIVVSVGLKIYIHGGMAREKFHSDMYSLDISSMKWDKVQAKGDIPPGVAAHSAVSLGHNIYIFGGLTSDGACNSMYRFHTVKNQWSLIKFKGDVPSNRLDHSMCVLPWKLHEGNGEESPATSRTLHLAFVFGGMDTEGVIFNDCCDCSQVTHVLSFHVEKKARSIFNLWLSLNKVPSSGFNSGSLGSVSPNLGRGTTVNL